jgi:acyl-coenzyme A synthetase/AMP-(fatty) acid ligase/pimeloyl-ACP methyl ester carboxylesterase
MRGDRVVNDGPVGVLPPGVDPRWSRAVTVTDAAGTSHRWHVLDNRAEPTIGTLLCVHGNPTWSYLWRRMLAKAPAGWRVIAPDHLGMGFSDRPDAPRTLAQRIDDLGALTDVLGVTGPVVTLGHDWGGAISLGWALAHREQLLGVVLGNTAVAQPPGDRGPLLIRLAHVPLLREIGCVRTRIFVWATSALSRPSLPRDVRRGLAAPYRTAARRRAIGDFVADIPFAQDHPSYPTVNAVAEGIRSLDVPALMLWGPRDPVFGEKYLADLRSRLPQAQLHRYEGASHLVTEDAPQYADAVAAWLEDTVNGTRGTREAPATTSPEQDMLWSALERRAEDQTPAIIDVGGATMSWMELHQRVRDLAAGMAAAGIRPGDRIGLMVEPSADLTVAVYAAWRAGAVIVVADKGLGFAGMRRALRSASIDHVVGAPAGLAAARLMGLPGSRIAVGSIAAAPRRALGAEHTLEELSLLGRSAAAPRQPTPDQECAVLFTSGSTGPAKGVLYRHAQASAQLELLRATYGLTAEDRLVAAFAPFALLGPALGIGSTVPDIDVTAPATLTAAALADAAAAGDATIVFASPAALRNVDATAGALSLPQQSALANIRLCMSAGAPVPTSLLESLQAVLPNAAFHTPYGMTEALPVTDVSLDELLRAGPGDGVCVGAPVPTAQVTISPLTPLGDADGDPTTEPFCTGEISVRAPHVKERYDALWATERASSREPGWHRTGDVGHLDEQGRLWVEGRLDHLITTPRGVITPVGVEQRVERLEEVRTAAAVGVGPPGTQMLAVVVIPADGVRRTGRHRRRRLRLAPTTLSDAVRAAAGAEVAAVMTAPALPVDIRHGSKIDRRAVSSRAARYLAGVAPR